MFFQFSNSPKYYSYTGCIKKGNPTLTGYLNVLNITFIGFLFRIYKDQAFSCQIVPLWIHSNKHNQIQSDLKWSVEIAFFHLQDLIKVMFFQFSNICPNACCPFGKRMALRVQFANQFCKCFNHSISMQNCEWKFTKT